LPLTYPLSLHDALPICQAATITTVAVGGIIECDGIAVGARRQTAADHVFCGDCVRSRCQFLPRAERRECAAGVGANSNIEPAVRSEEHTSELQSPDHLV